MVASGDVDEGRERGHDDPMQEHGIPWEEEPLGCRSPWGSHAAVQGWVLAQP